MLNRSVVVERPEFVPISPPVGRGNGEEDEGREEPVCILGDGNASGTRLPTSLFSRGLGTPRSHMGNVSKLLKMMTPTVRLLIVM